MSDRTLTCRDCGQEFTFTAGEQAFYQERGFSEPKRCPTCRNARKSQQRGGGDYGSDYSGGGSYSSGSYGNGSYSGNSGYNSGPRQLYPAICSACGKETEVPFPPRADKPVYCRECYQERRASSPRYSHY